MVAILFVSAVGAAVGGGIGAYLAYQAGRRRFTWPQEQGDNGSALLTRFSLDLWRLYVAVVSGGEVPGYHLEAASERALFLISRLRAQADVEEAMLDMLGLLEKARERAREHRRVGLRVSHFQFADLSAQISVYFALLQLEAERLRSQLSDNRTRWVPASAGQFLRRGGLKSVGRLRTDKDRVTIR